MRVGEMCQCYAESCDEAQAVELQKAHLFHKIASTYELEREGDGLGALAIAERHNRIVDALRHVHHGQGAEVCEGILTFTVIATTRDSPSLPRWPELKATQKGLIIGKYL